MTNPHPSEELVTRMAAAMMSEVFLLAQPDRGDVFSWLDDHSHEIARAALTAVNVDALRDALRRSNELMVVAVKMMREDCPDGLQFYDGVFCDGLCLMDDLDSQVETNDAALNSIGEESFGYER